MYASQCVEQGDSEVVGRSVCGSKRSMVRAQCGFTVERTYHSIEQSSYPLAACCTRWRDHTFSQRCNVELSLQTHSCTRTVADSMRLETLSCSRHHSFHYHARTQPRERAEAVER